MYIDFDPLDEESSLGLYLKAIREEKEMTIDELAEKTKIKRDYLDAIEADRYDELPKGPYLLLFLKSYSEILEIDYKKIASYLESLETPVPRPAKPKAPPLNAPREKKAKPRKMVDPKPTILKNDLPPRKQENGETVNYLAIIGVAIFIIFIAVIIIIVVSSKSTPKEGPKGLQEMSQALPEPQVDSAQILRQNFLDGFDSLTLSINPGSQQEFTVIIDGAISRKLLEPRNPLKIAAADSLGLACEREDNSRFYINGYELVKDQVSFSGERIVSFNKSNWIDFVDTTKTE